MTWPLGWDVRHVAETASTNTDLLDAVARGAAGACTVLAADHQTAGRGRLDRRWEAPAGANLLVSIALGPVPVVPASMTQRVGLAALRASRRVVEPRTTLGLKWPNDLLLDGRKLAGVLAQRVPGHDVVVVGLGLNVRWAPTGAASLAQASSPLAPDIEPVDVLHAVLEELDVLDALSAHELAAAYRSDLLTLGSEVRVELPGGSILEGQATDVDDLGRLIVHTATALHVLDVGDVVHVRSA